MFNTIVIQMVAVMIANYRSFDAETHKNFRWREYSSTYRLSSEQKIILLLAILSACSSCEPTSIVKDGREIRQCSQLCIPR